MPQETAAIWTADLNEEEIRAARNWAEEKFDIHREYDEHATLLSEAESGDFTVLVVKSTKSLGPEALKQLEEFGIRLHVLPGASKSK